METMNKFVSFVFCVLCAILNWTVKKIVLFLAPTHFINFVSHYAMESNKSCYKAKIQSYRF